MKKLIHKFSIANNSTTKYTILQQDRPAGLYATRRSIWPKPVGAGSNIRAGHLPVYVGFHQVERFVVDARHLNRLIFVELLDKAAQEIGYQQSGALWVPVNIVVFERLLESMQLGQEPSSIDELFKSIMHVDVL